MQYPIAEKFKNDESIKPTVKKGEFYKGGFFPMKQRLKDALKPFPGAYVEYSSRTEDFENPDAVGVMWEYVRLE